MDQGGGAACERCIVLNETAGVCTELVCPRSAGARGIRACRGNSRHGRHSLLRLTGPVEPYTVEVNAFCRLGVCWAIIWRLAGRNRKRFVVEATVWGASWLLERSGLDTKEVLE